MWQMEHPIPAQRAGISYVGFFPKYKRNLYMHLCFPQHKHF